MFYRLALGFISLVSRECFAYEVAVIQISFRCGSNRWNPDQRPAIDF